ncbi:MAG: RidA family protein [Acidimicrobiia bacterium]
MTTPERRVVELGIELPSVPKPAGSYVTVVRSGHLLYTSGHGPVRPDGSIWTGKVGVDVDIDVAAEAARTTCLNLLAILRTELGTLDRVTRVVKLLGMVNATPEFTQHPKVLNGCSDLLVEVFGDAGRHARSAVGMGSLPFGMIVEIEAIVETS